MKVVLNLEKSQSYLIFVFLLVIISIFVIGQNPSEFGHTYQELELRDSQGNGLIKGEDIDENTINANNLEKLGPYIKLSVLDAKNADAASCEFIIKSCNPGGETGKTCTPGYAPLKGDFGFTGLARDRDHVGGTSGICTGSGVIGICCKSP